MGFIFVLPFVLGFLAFILRPIVQSLIFSLNSLSITTRGFDLDFVGLDNYRYALFEHADFVRVFTESMIDIMVDIPAVIIFSFFAANLLNQEFRGRMLARVIFFLPVILMSGAIMHIGMPGWLGAQADSIARLAGFEGMFGGEMVEGLLLEMRMPQGFVDYIIEAVNRVPEIIVDAAIPILIFLAGLQSIPSSLYETAKIDGATGWESFWKITFPLLSPLFITNVIYIIVQSFTSLDNPLVSLIQNAAWGRGIYGATVAMSWMYFLAIGIIIMIVFGVLNKYIVYMD